MIRISNHQLLLFLVAFTIIWCCDIYVSYRQRPKTERTEIYLSTISIPNIYTYRQLYSISYLFLVWYCGQVSSIAISDCIQRDGCLASFLIPPFFSRRRLIYALLYLCIYFCFHLSRLVRLYRSCSTWPKLADLCNTQVSNSYVTMFLVDIKSPHCFFLSLTLLCAS